MCCLFAPVRPSVETRVGACLSFPEKTSGQTLHVSPQAASASPAAARAAPPGLSSSFSCWVSTTSSSLPPCWPPRSCLKFIDEIKWGPACELSPAGSSGVRSSQTLARVTSASAHAVGDLWPGAGVGDLHEMR